MSIKGQLIKTENGKCFKSENYNFIFNREDGFFARWGKTENDDPDQGLPEILDLEVTTSCAGVRGADGKRKPCAFCYKSNTSKGDSMSFETFKIVFDKLPKTITQIAFGADAEGTANKDLFKMMEYCRENDVVPNITIADITSQTAKTLSKYCGAVAVSYYPERDKNRCYDTVELLTSLGMKQINIHAMISKESFESTKQLFKDVKSDSRLSKLNAVVMLSLKKRGRGKNFNALTQDEFKELVDIAMNENIPFGFDSCSGPKFMKSVEGHKDFDKFNQMVEPCESGLFSTYIDYRGIFFPCSFSEGFGDWKEGLDVVKCKDFLKDIWFNMKTIKWKNELIATKDCNGCRNCPLFEV